MFHVTAAYQSAWVYFSTNHGYEIISLMHDAELVSQLKACIGVPTHRSSSVQNKSRMDHRHCGYLVMCRRIEIHGS